MSKNKSEARISPISIKPEMKIKPVDDREIEKIHEATGLIFISGFIEIGLIRACLLISDDIIN